MKIKRAASIPLILHDPYFSIWSSADHLYDADPVHWSGARQKMRGYLTVDGRTYTFLGDKEIHACLPQKSVEVTATATEYCFENEAVGLKVRFTSPLLLDDMKLVSRPCTYVDVIVDKKSACEVVLDLELYADLVRVDKDAVCGYAAEWKNASKEVAYKYASMGRAVQQPLNHSADKITIDWGYAYLASADKSAELSYDKANEKIALKQSFGEGESQANIIIAYDDLLSINYFGQWRKAYWTKDYATIMDAIAASFADKEEVCARAAKLDQDIEKKAEAAGGESYVFLCNMSYRQAIAAHKLITDDEGNVIFLSKENDSNGCIGTVDVSYPSVPLFLLYDTEYVKGMMRPIFKFAAMDVWEYDFAPHDVGRYPYAWGQVYGLNPAHGNVMFSSAQKCVYPPFYMYPSGSDVFALRGQMPVEECGNMLVMTAVVCEQDGNAEFARPHYDVLKQWTKYLLEFGADPGEQLCTDDFAGHLAHNTNLSVKAIMGIEAFARIAAQLGESEVAAEYHEKAAEMAKDWEKRANAGDHYVLGFGSPDTWSLKYNMAWDKFWGSNLFSKEVYETELAYYEKKTNLYGTPLDNRSTYTKSDWILWCAAMADSREQAEKLIKPVAYYLENSTTRVPFSDWYFTDSGMFRKFIARSVQGGIFMPMLFGEMK